MRAPPRARKTLRPESALQPFLQRPVCALVSLGIPSTSRDLRRGDIGAAWNERHDLGAAWAEITGQTQMAKSQVFTFYLDESGKVTAVR
jgi:hypothetical protein